MKFLNVNYIHKRTNTDHYRLYVLNGQIFHLIGLFTSVNIVDVLKLFHHITVIRSNLVYHMGHSTTWVVHQIAGISSVYGTILK